MPIMMCLACFTGSRWKFRTSMHPWFCQATSIIRRCQEGCYIVLYGTIFHAYVILKGFLEPTFFCNIYIWKPLQFCKWWKLVVYICVSRNSLGFSVNHLVSVFLIVNGHSTLWFESIPGQLARRIILSLVFPIDRNVVVAVVCFWNVGVYLCHSRFLVGWTMALEEFSFSMPVD